MNHVWCRWRATPLRQGEWADWFRVQLAISSATAEQGLYVGLRLDGRVRSSGKGMPPWPRYVAELAPTQGEHLFAGRVGLLHCHDTVPAQPAGTFSVTPQRVVLPQGCGRGCSMAWMGECCNPQFWGAQNAAVVEANYRF